MTEVGEQPWKPRVQWLPIDQLEFDAHNPRLEDDDRGIAQEELAALLDELYDAMEVAKSVANFGYFESEVLIGVRGDGEQIVIVEGNRRLAAVKGLSRPSIRAAFSEPKKWEGLAQIAAEKGNVPERVPVLVEPDRSAVIATIGYRHISGIKAWEPYQQARYVAERIDHDGLTPKEVAELTGITETQVRSKYRNFGIVKAAEALGIDAALIQESFGVWDAALGRVPIRTFIGAPDPGQVRPPDPVIQPENEERLKELVGWLFGPNKKIKESRDLGPLADVLGHAAGLAALRNGDTLQEAVQATKQPKSELDRVVTLLTTASSALRGASAIIADAEADGRAEEIRSNGQIDVLLDEIETAYQTFAETA